MTPLTVVKVLLALVPRAVIAVMQTTMIRASMTAYSTAVGPSSRFMKFTNAWVRFFMVSVLCSEYLEFTWARIHDGIGFGRWPAGQAGLLQGSKPGASGPRCNSRP